MLNQIKKHKKSWLTYLLVSVFALTFFVSNLFIQNAQAATEIRKPTAYTDAPGAPASVNHTNAYDTTTAGDTTTYATTPFTSGGASRALEYHTFQTTTYTYTALTLYVRYGGDGAATNDTYTINYSIDGGTSWVPLVGPTLGTSTITTASVALSASQNLSLLRVDVDTSKSGGSDGKNLYWYDIWTEGTYNVSPNAPTLVSPTNGAYVNNSTPTLSANYSDPDTGDTGTTNYRIATSAANCLAGTVVASGTSATTTTNNENTTWTPAASIGADGTYYWCAQNNDGVATSAWTSMGNFILDTTLPTVTSVNSTKLDGSYTIGELIPIQITFSENVYVVGSPELALNSSATAKAVYNSGSGSSVLTFNYTVAALENSADLDYDATNSLTLAGGSIRDIATNNATLTLPTPGAAGSLGANKAIVIDTTAPTVTNVTTNPLITNGTYTTGAVIPIWVVFSEPVVVTGTPQITLSTGSPASTAINYSGGTGTDTLIFNYIVASGNFTGDLSYVDTSSLTLNGGTIKDFVGGNVATLTLASPGAAGSLSFNKDIVIATVTPAVINVTSTNGSYKAGDTVSIQILFDNSVTVDTLGGTPRLELETGATNRFANYVSGSPGTTLNFDYIVQAGDTASDLDYLATNSLTLNGGSIVDTLTLSLNANLTLASPGAAGSLSYNRDVVIDTTAPSGYSISIDQSYINNANKEVTSFTFNNAEIGTTYNYTITTSGGGGSVTGSGTISSSSQQITGINVSSLADGTLTYSVTLTDTAGNIGSAATDTVTKDTSSPILTQVTPVPTPTNDTTPNYIFNTTEAGDITYGGSCSSTTNTATSGDNTITFSTLSEGTYSNCTITVTDSVGNTSNTLGVNIFVVDTTSPVITELIPVSTPTNDTTPDYTFNSDEAGDITYGGSCSSITSSASAGDNTIIFDTLTDGTYSDCTIIVTDLAGNSSNTLDVTPFTINTNVLSVILTTTSSNPTNISPIPVTATFSAPVDGTFIDTDVTVGNGILSNFTDVGGTHTVFTFDITPSAEGNVTIDIDAGKANDAAMNMNLAATQLAINYDITEPSVILTTTASDPTNISPIPVTATFSESVGTSFDSTDITVSNGTVTGFTGGPTIYTFNVLPTGVGTVTVDIDAGKAQDLAGNGNTVATQLSIDYDTAVPTVSYVTSSLGNGEYYVGQVVPIEVVFSKPVNVTGNPQIALATGSPATTFVNYSSGSGTNKLVFNYTVAPGNYSGDLDYTSINSLSLNGGTIKSLTGNNASLVLAVPGTTNSLGYYRNIIINASVPEITSVNSSTASGFYKAGDIIPIQVVFSRSVGVIGVPTLTLNNSVVVNYTGGNGTNTLIFEYTISSGEDIVDLDYFGVNSLDLNGGSIRGLVDSQDADISLFAPGSTGSLGYNKDISIDTVAPTAPGNLVVSMVPPTNSVITLDFGAATSDPNFYGYKIFYKVNNGSVTESDIPWTVTSDQNLGFVNYNGATSTQIILLAANTDYYFNIWAYDKAGNKASATEIGPVHTEPGNNAPYIYGVTATQDSSTGYVNINYNISDIDNEADCELINYEYSLMNVWPGTTMTAAPGGDGLTNLEANSGGSAHTFVWDAKANLGDLYDGTVYIRMRVNDGDDDSAYSSSAAFAVDSKNPIISNVVAYQEMDGSGIVTVNYDLSDDNPSGILVELEASSDGGITWTVPVASVTGDVGFGISSGSNTISWNVESDFAGQDIGNMQVRVKAKDSFQNQNIGVASSGFALDTLAPSGLSSLVVGATTPISVNLSWSGVTENNFANYYIWYGTSLSDVENRTGSALFYSINDINTISATISSGIISDTTFYFKIWAVDDFGNEETVGSVSAYTDFPSTSSISTIVPSSGNIGSTVTINGSGFGATQGTSTVKFFNNITATVIFWSDTAIQVQVPVGATTGMVTVTTVGGTSNGVSFTVGTVTPPSSGGGGVPLSPLPDTTPPTGVRILINGGASETAIGNVILNIIATDAAQMIVSNSITFAGSNWEPFVSTKMWNLTFGDGVKTVYARFRDAAGNTTSIISDTIILKTVGDIDGNIGLESGPESDLITKDSGGEFLSNDRGVKISFPAGSVVDDIAVEVTIRENYEIANPINNLVLIRGFDADAFYISTGERVTGFEKDVTITIDYGKYHQEVIDKYEENSLELYYFDELKKDWILIPSTLDTVNNLLVATIRHFTRYAVFGKPKTAPVENFGEYIVQPFDSLKSVARKLYGDGEKWTRLVELNRDRYPSLKDGGVNLIYTGWRLRYDFQFPGEIKEKVRNIYDYQLINQSPYPSSLQPGETTNVWVEVKNTGTATWGSNVRLGSGSKYGNRNQQQDYASEFANHDWLSANRPTSISPTGIIPGWHARFQFTIKAPTTNGNYKAYFTPVADGITWMNDIGIYWEINVGDNTIVSPEPIPNEEPIVESGEFGYYTVQKNDDLKMIASMFYGDGEKWKRLVELNRDKFPTVTDQPNIIYSGWILRYDLPKSPYDYEIITQSSYPVVMKAGETTDVWIEVKNTGTQTWYSNNTRLGTGSKYGNENQQQDYISEFTDSSWISPNRCSAILNDAIIPGWHTRFQFKIKAPPEPGVYRAYFTPVVEGVGWMRDRGIYWEIQVE